MENKRIGKLASALRVNFSPLKGKVNLSYKFSKILKGQHRSFLKYLASNNGVFQDSEAIIME